MNQSSQEIPVIKGEAEKKGSWGMLYFAIPGPITRSCPIKALAAVTSTGTNIYKMPWVFLGSYWKKKGVTQLYFVLTVYNLFPLETWGSRMSVKGRVMYTGKTLKDVRKRCCPWNDQIPLLSKGKKKKLRKVLS